VCPAGEDTFDVDKTARGGDAKALEVPKKLDRCQHSGASARGGSRVALRQAECERLLARTEELINQAERDVELAQGKQDAYAELDRLEMLIDTAETNLNEVPAEQDEALDRAADLEHAPALALIEATVDEAEDTVDQAAGIAHRITRSNSGSLPERAVLAPEAVRLWATGKRRASHRAFPAARQVVGAGSAGKTMTRRISRSDAEGTAISLSERGVNFRCPVRSCRADDTWAAGPSVVGGCSGDMSTPQTLPAPRGTSSGSAGMVLRLFVDLDPDQQHDALRYLESPRAEGERRSRLALDRSQRAVNCE
jgi:hypothetical protein